MYTTLMTAYGASVGVDFKFGGTVANTLDAHRLIWWVQEEVDAGEEVTVRLVECEYLLSLSLPSFHSLFIYFKTNIHDPPTLRFCRSLIFFFLIFFVI